MNATNFGTSALLFPAEWKCSRSKFEQIALPKVQGKPGKKLKKWSCDEDVVVIPRLLSCYVCKHSGLQSSGVSGRQCVFPHLSLELVFNQNSVLYHLLPPHLSWQLLLFFFLLFVCLFLREGDNKDYNNLVSTAETQWLLVTLDFSESHFFSLWQCLQLLCLPVCLSLGSPSVSFHTSPQHLPVAHSCLLFIKKWGWKRSRG